jgi:hypothetical protein
LPPRIAPLRQMFGPMLGARILWPTIGMVPGHGAQKVGVDVVHGFRPAVRLPLGMPENLRYCDSAIFTGRKMKLRVALA